MGDLFKIKRYPTLNDNAVVVSPPNPVVVAENPSKLPQYPLCQELFASQDGFISCMSIFKELENKAGQAYLQNRLKMKKGLSIPLPICKTNVVWNGEEWEPCTDNETQEEFCVAVEDLPKFVEWAQLNTRKKQPEKVRNFNKFNIETDTIKVKVPIENELLDALQQAIPYKMELQYRVGKYRVDAFIPRLRIAVEIDENNHKNYDKNEQKEYEEVLRDANIILIRFNPHEKYNELVHFALIKKVWERSIAPDFSAFRDKLKLP